jgi:CTP:phosphocholine cytidylyltransferase-like protein
LFRGKIAELIYSKDVVEIFNSPGGKEKYWDQVPLERCIGNYKIGIRECSASDLIEIDTFNELKELDETYR